MNDGDITNLVHWACIMKNENILKECIKMKYNLNEKTVFLFDSPLMLAVTKANNLNIIKLLINNGADLNYVNYDGQCVFDRTSNEEYLSFLKSSGAQKIEKQMSKLTIEIKNNQKCSVTTKETVNQVDAHGLTPFLLAIYYQRQNYIDYYIELGADVNQAGKTGITPLMMAVRMGSLNIVKKLVESGANINQLDNKGLSALAYYNWYAKSNISNYLIENGAKIDPCTSGNGTSPLIIAAIGNAHHFDYFLNKNANVNFIDSDGNTALSYAILNEDTQMAEKLIAKGAIVDLCGPKGKTPLAWSVFLNKPEITQFLLDNGAKINQTDHQGRTALYYAEKYQYTNIIKLLKDNGAKPKTIRQNNDIFSAIQAKDTNSIKKLLGNFSFYHKNEENQDIFAAIQAKDMNLIKKLLNNLNIYHTNEKNETIIDAAVQVGDFDIVKLVLEREHLFVQTALPTAIQTENIQLVKLFLEKGAKVNRIYPKINQSPLLQAINQQDADIVELLLKFNANVRSNEEPSPFQRALQLKNENIIKMLMDKGGIDVNEPQNGKSLLQIAIDENNINVVMFLLNKGADPRNVLGSLKEMAKEFDVLEIYLENIFHQESSEATPNKTETT